MSVTWTHAFRQGPCVGTLFGVAMGSMLPRKGGEIEAPGPKTTETLAPRAEALVGDYIDWTGGSRDAYAGQVPPHLFPQWGFPPMADALGRLPWPMARILNQGCRLEVNGPIPADKKLVVSAWLAEVSQEPHKARITTRIVTGTEEDPELVVADVHAVVPLKKREGGGKREPPVVPADATELHSFALSSRAGLDFALLTGDFNPIHWIPPYARMAGFKRTILHGFASMALAWEAIVAKELGGDPSRLQSMDIRFVRPQLIPDEVGIYLGPDGAVAMGKGPGERATMLGTFQTKPGNAQPKSSSTS